jgi:hypothetical protein
MDTCGHDHHLMHFLYFFSLLTIVQWSDHHRIHVLRLSFYFLVLGFSECLVRGMEMNQRRAQATVFLAYANISSRRN